jgi:hypothetical protein
MFLRSQRKHGRRVISRFDLGQKPGVAAAHIFVMLLHPTSDLSSDTPIRQVRFTWAVRRVLIEAGLKTVGDVREAKNETLLGLKLNSGTVDFIRATLGRFASGEERT